MASYNMKRQTIAAPNICVQLELTKKDADVPPFISALVRKKEIFLAYNLIRAAKSFYDIPYREKFTITPTPQLAIFDFEKHPLQRLLEPRVQMIIVILEIEEDVNLPFISPTEMAYVYGFSKAPYVLNANAVCSIPLC
jgi:hypothetical protein